MSIMYMVKIGSERFWDDYDKHGGEYPLRIGDRIYWNGTIETSRGTIVDITPGVNIGVSYDRYRKHGPGRLPVAEVTLRDPKELYYWIVGTEDFQPPKKLTFESDEEDG